MTLDFKEKVVIVTGGTGGLGRVVVRDFLGLGAQVVVPSSSDESLRSFHARHGPPGGRLFTGVADLTNEEEVNDFVKQVSDRQKKIDILVHAAGGFAGGKLVEETSLKDFDKMIRINLLSAFLIVKGVLPVMKEHDSGRIVLVTALPALRPSSRSGAYAMAKRGVATLMETIAEEVRGTGITSNAVAPGVIITEANKAAMPDADLSQWVTPEQVSRTILFLSSDAGSGVNGSVLRMFGGLR